jgi:hypothetical protein
MTIDDFEKKYKWIKNISDDLINTKNLSEQLHKLQLDYSWLNL